MSLVDYADSSDEDEPRSPAAEDEHVKGNHAKRPHFEAPAPAPSTSAPQTNNRICTSKQMEIVSNESAVVKLPDASFLLNSPAVPSNQFNSLDHSSRVTAAMAESAARKRENGPAVSYPRSKLPKGALPHSKNVPETVSGHLIPPQLSGRSNIVTEDISRLFVRKQSDSPAE